MAGYHELRLAELHLHLEGSVTPDTIREIVPGLAPEEVRKRYQFSDFLGFIECFRWVTGHLQTPENYALITRRLLKNLECQNVQYAEITLSAGVVIWKGQEIGRASCRERV